MIWDRKHTAIQAVRICIRAVQGRRCRLHRLMDSVPSTAAGAARPWYGRRGGDAAYSLGPSTTWGAVRYAYSLNGACTNWAETFFSRMRRAEIGHHHHLAGPYLLRFAQEASWREDNRRLSNGEQVNRVAGLAMASKQPVDFCGYWQRHVRAG
jgi:hypothetical protein